VKSDVGADVCWIISAGGGTSSVGVHSSPAISEEVELIGLMVFPRETQWFSG